MNSENEHANNVTRNGNMSLTDEPVPDIAATRTNLKPAETHLNQPRDGTRAAQDGAAATL